MDGDLLPCKLDAHHHLLGEEVPQEDEMCGKVPTADGGQVVAETHPEIVEAQSH